MVFLSLSNRKHLPALMRLVEATLGDRIVPDTRLIITNGLAFWGCLWGFNEALVHTMVVVAGFQDTQ
jgi:hypothetical protein